MKARFYQKEASDALIHTLFNEPGEAPVIAMPTGTGKSVVIADAAQQILERVPTVRIAVATHSQELVAQDSDTLQRYWAAAPFGIYSAGLKLKQSSMPITFANIQSMARNPKAFGKLGGVLVDEAHAIAPAETSMYQKTFEALRNENPDMFVAGLTATPFRLGQGLLTDGPTFTKFCYDVTGRRAFVRFLEMGYLCPLIPKPTTFQFDLSKVHMVAGDFNQKELQAATNVDELTYKALQEAMQCAHSRNHWMIFCAGIEHVEAVTAMLQSFGEDAVYVHSKISADQRKSSIERFRNGQARMIVNDGILTTGVDFPHVDCIVLLRPTSSPGLHVQILGRGTRCDYTVLGLAKGSPEYFEHLDASTDNRLAAIEASHKHNCLVLDFSGNTERCGPINDPRIPKKKGKGTGEVPVKICPACGSYVHAAQRFCDGINWDDTKCNYEFQFETHLEQTAATSELIVRDAPQMAWFPVDRIEYEVKTKPFTPPMMRVKYYSGIRRFTENVCIEHQSYAGKVARDWWRARLPEYDPPPTTHDGMTAVSLLKVPTHIYVHVNTKYPKVLSASFDGSTPEYKPHGSRT